jgi:glc operon protein GlcG
MRRLGLALIAPIVAAALLHDPAAAQVIDRKGLGIDGARRAIAAAAAEAVRAKAGGAIAVVDEGGSLLALERLDGTFAASASISIGKARTAAIFRRPTKAFEEIIRAGRTPMIALEDFTPLQGGVPIVVAGQVVGAVGVSGAASAEQDEEIAQVAARAVTAPGARGAAAPAGVTHVAASGVAAAFAKGMPLLEVDGYKIHASRRDGPGLAEVHDWETDVVYVLDGSATLVTGGAIVEPRLTEPGQVRGPQIEGGEVHRLGRGDVIVIPAGVPHWFREVQAPFTYFVVKPIGPREAGR